MTAVLAALAGACTVAGLLIAIAPAREVAGVPVRRDALPRRLTLLGRGAVPRWHLLLAGGAGLSAWAVTSWPVAALIAAAAVLGLPALLGTARTAAAAIKRLEGLEEWARRIADILVAGAGLEQALIVSLRTCPPAIEPVVSALVARLQARWPLERALRAMADDVADPAGDLLVAALILSSRRRGAGLAKVLTSVADSIAEEVAARRRIEAERAKPRTTARAVTLITVVIAAVGSTNRLYLEPYGQPIGQLVLLLLALAFAACLLWMRRMTQADSSIRILGPAPSAEPSQPDRAGIQQGSAR